MVEACTRLGEASEPNSTDWTWTLLGSGIDFYRMS